MSTPTPPPGTAVQAGPELFINPPNFSGGFSTQGAPAVTAPTFPATTVAVTNTTGVDVFAYVLNGAAAISLVKINGVSTVATLAITTTGTFLIPAGSSIAFTYASGTPTWTWQAV